MTNEVNPPEKSPSRTEPSVHRSGPIDSGGSHDAGRAIRKHNPWVYVLLIFVLALFVLGLFSIDRAESPFEGLLDAFALLGLVTSIITFLAAVGMRDEDASKTQAAMEELLKEVRSSELSQEKFDKLMNNYVERHGNAVSCSGPAGQRCLGHTTGGMDRSDSFSVARAIGSFLKLGR